MNNFQKIILAIIFTIVLSLYIFIWGWGGLCKEKFQYNTGCLGRNLEGNHSYNIQRETRIYYSIGILIWAGIMYIIFFVPKKKI